MKKNTDIIIACCRDEEDIIGDFNSFYLKMGFDYICLIDNGSKDHTLRQILYHPQKKKIQLISDPRPGYDKRLLTYYNHFALLATRWAFFIDVDEYIFFPHGFKKFADKLSKETTVLRLPVAEMLPNLETPEGKPLRSTQREAKFQRESKVVWKTGEIEKIYCGKHGIERQDYTEFKLSDIFIRHYHTRSRQQFTSKLRNRIETDRSITPSERASLSLFKPSISKKWVADSEKLLAPGGWEQEVNRIKKTPSVEDLVVSNWYEEHLLDEVNNSISPAINIELNSVPYYCFSVNYYLSNEGHTANEHLVLLHAPELTEFLPTPNALNQLNDLPIRIHSECLFGDVFGSGHCDCAQQLEESQKQIKKTGKGIIFYLRQEGRGIGLSNKIHTMTLPDRDSFHRNERLGMPSDKRNYSLVGQVLRYLGINQVQLISGNPAKLESLRKNGINAKLSPMYINENLSNSANDEIESKLRRGYTYLRSNENGRDTK